MQELVQMLVSQLGVEEGQARGGAGLLFKFAQDKLGGDFSKVAEVIPDVQNLIKAAPSGGGLGGMLGGLASSLGGGSLGDLAELAGGFGKLKLDPSMIQKFAPIVLDFVKQKAGPEVAGLLGQLLAKSA